MWNLINCYLSGRHDYGMWCEPGAMFLRCVHCGKRSQRLGGRGEVPPDRAAAGRDAAVTLPPARVIPFDRAAAS